MRVARGVITAACALVLGCAGFAGESELPPTLSFTGTPGPTVTIGVSASPSASATPISRLDGGPCVDGRLNMPDSSTGTVAHFTLPEAERLVVEAAAELFGIEASALELGNKYLETVEIWGDGVLWYVGKVDRPDGSDGDLFYVDLVSGAVITYAEYESCYLALVALGGPFEPAASPAPSWSPGPGLAGISMGQPYLHQPIAPLPVDSYPPEPFPYAGEQLAEIYQRVSPLLWTVNGHPYVDARTTFNCSSIRCKITIRGMLANAPGFDWWTFDLGPDDDQAALVIDGYLPQWTSVPYDAILELKQIVAVDPEASRRADANSHFDYAVWYPKHPELLGLAYSTPGGVIPGPPMANATTHHLIIKINIVERRVVAYVEKTTDL